MWWCLMENVLFRCLMENSVLCVWCIKVLILMVFGGKILKVFLGEGLNLVLLAFDGKCFCFMFYGKMVLWLRLKKKGHVHNVCLMENALFLCNLMEISCSFVWWEKVMFLCLMEKVMFLCFIEKGHGLVFDGKGQVLVFYGKGHVHVFDGKGHVLVFYRKRSWSCVWWKRSSSCVLGQRKLMLSFH